MLYQNKESTVRNYLGKEGDFFHTKNSEMHMMKDITAIKKEALFLDHINLRLGKELAELQVKLNIHPGSRRLRNDPHDDSKQGNMSLNISKFSQVSPELSYLEPLFIAYDDKVEKMERLLYDLYEDFRDMEKKADYLVQDNSSLRKQLEDKLKLERDDLNERISLLTEENKELNAKFQRISGRYGEMNRRTEEKSESSTKYEQQYHEVSHKLKNLETEYAALKQQKGTMEVKYRDLVDQLSHLESEKIDMTSRIGRTENELKGAKSQLAAVQRNSSKHDEQTRTDLEALRREVDSLRQSETESNSKVAAADKDLGFLKEENRKLNKDRATLQTENEKLKLTVENQASVIAIHDKKEDSLARTQKGERGKMEEAILEMDKALLREQEISKTLQSIQERKRQEIEELKEQHERIIEKERENHNKIVSEKVDRIHELGQQLQTVTYQKEKLSKENQNLQNEYKKLTDNNQELPNALQSQKNIELTRIIADLEEKIRVNEQFYSDRNHSVGIEKSQIETSFKNQQNIINDLKTSNDRYRQEAQLTSKDYQTMESKVNSSEREKKIILEEIQKTKRLFEAKLEYTQTQFSVRIKEVQDQLNEALKREKLSREKAIELLETHDRIENKMKHDYEMKIREMETLQHEIQEENKELHQKCKRLFEHHK